MLRTQPLLLAAAIGSLAASGSRLQAAEATPVNALVAEESTLTRTTTQPATLHAYYTAEIRSRVSGYVAEVLVDLCDRVKQGDRLAVIDTPDLSKRVTVAEARVTRAEAQEARADAAVRLAGARRDDARSGVTQAEAAVASTEAALTADESEFTRTEAMVKSQSVQPKLLDEARERGQAAVADVAAAAVAKSRSMVAVAEAAIAAAEADRTAAAADTQLAIAEREELQVMLDYAVLRAPFDGVVTERRLSPGDLLQAGGGSASALAFVVQQTGKLRVRMSVPEAEASLVHLGDSVEVRLASTKRPLSGVVSRTSASLDPRTRTLIVEIDVPNPDGKLLPGMYGEVTLRLLERPGAVVLPASAVRFGEDGKAFVYVIGDGSVVSVRPVTLGFDDGATIEVTGSVAPGERVVAVHLKRFGEGEVVRVLE